VIGVKAWIYRGDILPGDKIEEVEEGPSEGKGRGKPRGNPRS
jgi:ribosomal protein S3